MSAANQNQGEKMTETKYEGVFSYTPVPGETIFAWPRIEKADWYAVICGVQYHPEKGNVPNAFHRFMQKLAFGVKWVKK